MIDLKLQELTKLESKKTNDEANNWQFIAITLANVALMFVVAGFYVTLGWNAICFGSALMLVAGAIKTHKDAWVLRNTAKWLEKLEKGDIRHNDKLKESYSKFRAEKESLKNCGRNYLKIQRKLMEAEYKLYREIEQLK